jgi:hypothetical protein
MKIEGKLYAYISDLTYCDIDKLKEGDIAQLSFSTHKEMRTVGWTPVGEVNISFDMISDNEIVNNAIGALRAKQAAIRAEATAACTKIEGLVNQLLCIDNSPTVSEVVDAAEF